MYINNKIRRQFSDYRYMGVVTINSPVLSAGYPNKLTLTPLPGMYPDFSDIAISSIHGDMCNFWIERPTLASKQVIWIKPTSYVDNKLLIFWGGNSRQKMPSSPVNLFTFFDHFDGTALNTSVWSVASGGFTIANSLAAGTSDIRSSTAHMAVGYSVRCCASMVANVVNIIGTMDKATSPYSSFRFLTDIDFNDHYEAQYGGSVPSGTDLGTGYTGFHIWEIARLAQSSQQWWVDDASVKTYAQNEATALTVRLSGNSASTAFDWVLVRPCSATEPILNLTYWGRNPYFHNSMTGLIA